jgi:hypothetical protein
MSFVRSETRSPAHGRAGSLTARTTSTVAVLVLLGACGIAGAADDRPSSVAYTSPVYGYSISHPPRWTVVEASRALADGEPPGTSSGAADILGRGASVRVRTMELPGVIIAAEPVANDVHIAKWTAMVKDTVKVMKNCDPPNRREHLDIGGESATLLTYRDCPTDLGYLHLWAGVVHEGRGYHIVWFNDPGSEASDRRTFRRMLSTMSFDG